MLRPCAACTAACLLTASLALVVPAAQARIVAVSGTAAAEVVEPLQTRSLNPLDFGLVSRSRDVAVTVTVAPGQTASPDSDARGARISVAGTPGRVFRVAVPREVIARSDVPGDITLTVDDIRVRTASRPDGQPRGVLDQKGTDTIEVGGTLTIPAGTGATRYRAEVPIVVVYG